MAGIGRIYKRGEMFFIAYSHRGHEFRESTRSRKIEDARRLLEARIGSLSQPQSAPLTAAPTEPTPEPETTFQELVDLYLEDYEVRQFRGPKTAKQRVKNLRRFFEAVSASAITLGLVRQYQAKRRRNGAAAATINRETAALRRMCRLAVSVGKLTTLPLFPESLPESAPRQSFFEHREYQAVRMHLPPPYQDVLDFAYYSG